MSWNASLASSAVSAANEVYDAVKATQTATRAKRAAETAALKAHEIYQTSSFSTTDEAQQAQAHASSLQGQAIHAAVVEYEAVTAKRHASMALARDVKCWNVHRKQQLIKSCLGFIKSQHRMARNSVKIWKGLQEGLLQTSSISTIVNSSVQPIHSTQSLNPEVVEIALQSNYTGLTEDEILSNHANTLGVIEDTNNKSEEDLHLSLNSYIDNPEYFQSKIEYNESSESHDRTLNKLSFSESTYDNISSATLQRDRDGVPQSSYEADTIAKASELDVDIHDKISAPVEPESGIDLSENGTHRYQYDSRQSDNESADDVDSSNIGENTQVQNELDVSIGNGMTSSMQSLVDGLMNWGGQWDDDEDHTPLPDGMAASILEENRLFYNLQ